MNRTVWAIVIGVVILAALSIGASLLVAFARGPGNDYGWGMMGPWMMGGFGFPFVGGIAMFVFWVFVIGGVIWLIQSLARGAVQPGTGTPAGELPLDILKRRYAKGEISKEQLDEMKRDLGE